MGWSGGSEIASRVFRSASEFMSEDVAQAFAKDLISIFEDYDCDTMYECEEIQQAAKGKVK